MRSSRCLNYDGSYFTQINDENSYLVFNFSLNFLFSFQDRWGVQQVESFPVEFVIQSNEPSKW